MRFGKDFPVSEYYRPHIVDGETLARTGGWWTAILLIREPRDGRLFLALYRWQLKGKEWKTRVSLKLHAGSHVRHAIAVLDRFVKRLEAEEDGESGQEGA